MSGWTNAKWVMILATICIVLFLILLYFRYCSYERLITAEWQHTATDFSLHSCTLGHYMDLLYTVKSPSVVSKEVWLCKVIHWLQGCPSASSLTHLTIQMYVHGHVHVHGTDWKVQWKLPLTSQILVQAKANIISYCCHSMKSPQLYGCNSLAQRLDKPQLPLLRRHKVVFGLSLSWFLWLKAVSIE